LIEFLLHDGFLRSRKKGGRKGKRRGGRRGEAPLRSQGLTHLLSMCLRAHHKRRKKEEKKKKRGEE